MTRHGTELARHYTSFRVAQRLLLTGHSHQAWPDVARDAVVQAFDDAARDVDAKWAAAFAKADELRAGVREWLGERESDLALGANTHELVLRFLSSVDLRARPRLVTTDGEFHTLRRQLDRLAEEGVDVVRVPAEPVRTLAARAAEAVDHRTSAVLISAVLFETARIVPGLGELATACHEREVELVVDAYHALGVLPLPLHELGLADAWVVGGGYKYLQLGEGNCFLRLPAHAQRMRPALTGWFAEFGALADGQGAGRVGYAAGSDRFAGATYDPTSHYRAARVLRFFADHELTPARLREISQHQVGLLARRFAELDLPESIVSMDRSVPLAERAGFLALRCADAGQLQRALAEEGVHTDCRGEFLRLGPAPYLRDDQLESAIAALGEVAAGS